jgi:thioredoxin reductase
MTWCRGLTTNTSTTSSLTARFIVSTPVISHGSKRPRSTAAWSPRGSVAGIDASERASCQISSSAACDPGGSPGLQNRAGCHVGGGNSAGQAALFLSRSCAAVHLIIRRDELGASMSRYLVDRIERNPGIVVWPSTQVTALTGTDHLEAVWLPRTGEPEASELAVTGLFVFIGAKPGTGWLAGQLAEDRHGFLLTGSDIPATRLETRI